MTVYNCNVLRPLYPAVAGIKCYYDGEDVTHLIKLSPSTSGDKLAETLSQVLPPTGKTSKETLPAPRPGIAWLLTALR